MSTAARPAHLEDEAQGADRGGLVVAEALAGGGVRWSLNRNQFQQVRGGAPCLVKTRQSRWLLPSQILSNRCRLTLCLSTRAILYRTLQLSDSKGKAVL